VRRERRRSGGRGGGRRVILTRSGGRSPRPTARTSSPPSGDLIDDACGGHALCAVPAEDLVDVPGRVLAHRRFEGGDSSVPRHRHETDVPAGRRAELPDQLGPGERPGAGQLVGPAGVGVVEQRDGGDRGDVVHRDRGAGGLGPRLPDGAGRADLRCPHPRVLHEVTRPQMGPPEPARLHGAGHLAPPARRLAGQVDDAADARRPGERQDVGDGLGRGHQGTSGRRRRGPRAASRGGGGGRGRPARRRAAGRAPDPW